jgi:hypothetical protein
MVLTIRKFTVAVVVSFCAGALVSPVFTQSITQPDAAKPAQQAPTQASAPTFMFIEYMKVTDGQDETWMKLESEQWKPMHNLRVKNGAIKSWAAVYQAVPADTTHGPIAATVTTFQGWPDPTKTNWPDLFQMVHKQNDFGALVQKTEAARKIVRAEIWQVLDATGQ